MSAFNFFRVTGDFLHAASNVLLIKKIHQTSSCASISLKTQLLYTFVFVTRYLDIFWNFSSIYNWLFKIFYLLTTFYTVYLIAFKHNESYQAILDSTPLPFIIVPAYVIALIVARPWTPFEIFWSGSLFLESFSMIPQFYLLYKSLNIDTFAADYVACLGGYRAFYVMNWIYRTVKGQSIGWINWVTGIIQVILFSEFFYYWLKSKINNEKIKLPQ